MESATIVPSFILLFISASLEMICLFPRDESNAKPED